MKVGEFFDEWNIKYRELDETDIDMEEYDLKIPVNDVRETKEVESFHIDHERKEIILR